MEQYILKRWEGVELFINLVTKYELDGASKDSKKNKNIFFSDRIHIEKAIRNDLRTKLKQYSNITVSKTLADEIFPPIAAHFGKDLKFPKVTTELCNNILKGRQIRLSVNLLDFILYYIGESNAIDRYEIETYIDPKKHLFENSTWFLYFREPYFDSISKVEVMGIGKVGIKFFSFGYMEIYYARINNGEVEEPLEYKGQYYTKNNKFLFVEGRIENERELRIIFKFKQDQKMFEQGEISVGYYLNARENINFGPVLIEKLNFDLPLDAKVFKDKNKSIYNNDVANLYWQFFEMEFATRFPLKAISKNHELEKLLININSDL